MKCTNCDFESEQSYAYCPNCGTKAPTAADSQSPAGQTILKVLTDPLFLVICILMSVSCIMALSADGIPLIEILLTVFLWLTYAQSRKGVADAKHLRCISGTVYAQYVINYVVAVLVLVTGVIFSVAFAYLAGNPEFLETLFLDLLDDEPYQLLMQILPTIPGGLVLAIFVLASAIVIVVNIFTLRYIHRFAQSVYRSIETGCLDLKHTTAAQVLLFIIGGATALGCLSALADNSISALVGSAASSGIAIIAGLLIRKHLTVREQQIPEL